MNYCEANSRATYSVKFILKSLSKERKCKKPNVRRHSSLSMYSYRKSCRSLKLFFKQLKKKDLIITDDV